MFENYRKINIQKDSNYEYCIITMPFVRHMKAAYIDIFIFTLHGVWFLGSPVQGQDLDWVILIGALPAQHIL